MLQRSYRPLLAVLLFLAPAFAQPAGVSNFHKVDDMVYRGAQPTSEGFGNLAEMGIKTVIDLREPGSRSRAEKIIVESYGMRYVSIPLKGWSAPSPKDIARVLELFADSSAGPFFVHCRRGADRTGTVIACYRIARQHWENRRALSEAKSFGMSWMELSMKRYVLAYNNSPALER
jgi:protein tyrosine/serine phosphatase